MNDRGVSEVLGFVLVFALVVGTIGVVYGTGIVGLHDAQQTEKVNNVERAFDVLSDNLEDVHRDGVPSRATEVKLAGGSLQTGEEVTIRISAVNTSGERVNVTSADFEPIAYVDDGGTEIIYSNGAILRWETRGGVMLSDPGWVTGPNRSVIPIVATAGDGGSIGGEADVLIVAQRETRKPPEPFTVGPQPDVADPVNVTVTSPRVDIWERFFEEQGFAIVERDPANESVTGQFETETLYVPQTEIAVSFNR